MPDTSDLVASNTVSAFFYHFLKGPKGNQRVPQFASECSSVALQCSQRYVALGFCTLRIDDRRLGDSD
jgi:hypothetical protein